MGFWFESGTFWPFKWVFYFVWDFGLRKLSFKGIFNKGNWDFSPFSGTFAVWTWDFLFLGTFRGPIQGKNLEIWLSRDFFDKKCNLTSNFRVSCMPESLNWFMSSYFKLQLQQENLLFYFLFFLLFLNLLLIFFIIPSFIIFSNYFTVKNWIFYYI